MLQVALLHMLMTGRPTFHGCGRSFTSVIPILLLASLPCSRSITPQPPHIHMEVDGVQVTDQRVLVNKVFRLICTPYESPSAIDHYHFRRNNADLGVTVSNILTESYSSARTLSYQCQASASAHSAWGVKITVHVLNEPCSPTPCHNDNVCIDTGQWTFICDCRDGFSGQFCEENLALSAVLSWNPANEEEAVSSLGTVMTASNAFLSQDLATVGITSGALNFADSVLDSLVGKLTNASYSTEGSVSMTTDIIGFVDNSFSSLGGANCLVDRSACKPQNMDMTYRNAESSLYNLSKSILDGTSTGMTSMQNGNTTLEIEKIQLTTGETMSSTTAGAIIEVPPSIGRYLTATANGPIGAGRKKRSASSLRIMAITYSADVYGHATTPLTPDGKVINFKIQDDNGQDIPLTVKDPVTLTLTPLSPPTNDLNASASYNISLITLDEIDILVLEVDIPEGATVTFIGNLENVTSDTTPSLELRASKPGGVTEVYNTLMFQSVIETTGSRATLKVFSKNVTRHGPYMIFNTTYSGISDPTLIKAVQTYTLKVVAWNPASLSWYTPTGLHVQGLSPTSGVRFTSNIFGSFSVSRIIIAPVDLDFSGIFAEFSNKLEDSPYVLAVICSIGIASILIVLYLRRLDVTDSTFWAYLPLVDNSSEDKWLYTLSVHTAVGSGRTMTSLPYFILFGEHSSTYIRVLYDGVRRNFTCGSVSNFVMTSPVWLGSLRSIRIWTDGQGDQPHWLLERIVLVDVATDDSYVFLCTDWFSPTKGSGLLCHSISALNEEMTEENKGMSMVSREKLYEEHLWLSVIRRPSYSTFTRVQRFLTAVALLYLAMLTNAMFYQGDEKTMDKSASAQTTGLRLGPVTISYREVYVGLVSGFIIVVPGFALTWLFTHRKLRGCSANDVAGDGDCAEKSAKNPFGESLDDNVATAEDPELWRESKSCLSDATKDDAGTLVLMKAIFSPVLNQDSLIPEENNTSETPSKTTAPKNQNKTRPRFLPWWCIFIGYGVITVIVAVSVTLTFLYSLQWGGTTSLEWLVSLVFSTSSSAFVIDPIKILLIAMVISCLINKFTVAELTRVAPYKPGNVDIPPRESVPPIIGPPSTDSKTMVERKRELNLQGRFQDLMKSFAFRAVMVILVAVICFHNDVNMAFHQNEVVERIWRNGNSSEILHTQADIWAWLRHTVVPKVLPTTDPTGQPLTPYQRTFTADQEHYRLGPLRVIQYRVKDICNTEMDRLEEVLQNVICRVDYSSEDAEKGAFHEGWKPCNGSCSQPEFIYVGGDTYSLSQLGSIAFYGPGGYQALLTTNLPLTMATIDSLEAKDWIDHLTRGILVELTVFNANTRLFTQTKALLEAPSVGGILTILKVQSARLYPYTTVWDFLVLVIQIIFVFTVIVRTCMLVSAMVCVRDKTKISFSRVATSFELLLSWTCITVYIVRIHYTMKVIERLNNHPGIFTSFDLVFLLDEMYVVCVSVLMFLRILLILEPLKLNIHLYVMRQTLISSLPQLGGYAIVLLSILTAFASFFYLTRGAVTRNLRNLPKCYISLLTVLLGHGKYRIVGGEEEGAEASGEGEVIFRVMYGFFCLGATILMINLAVTILLTYITEIKTDGIGRSIRKGGFDRPLNEYLWKKIDHLLKSVFSASAVDAVAKNTEKCIGEKDQLPEVTASAIPLQSETESKC